MSSGDTMVPPLDLTDASTFVEHDPYEYWRAVRACQPVYWHESGAGRPGFWVVAGYHDVVSAYQNVSALSSARGTVLDVLLHGDDPASGRMLAVTDRPRHRQLRALMAQAFAPRVLDPVVHEVHQRAARLVRQLADIGSFDFATEVAEHIPLQTICDLLSISDQDRKDLLEWSKRAVSSDNVDSDELDAQEARNEIVVYFMDLAQERRVHPGDDVISMLAGARIDSRPLTLEEVALNCYSIVLGGDESSRMSAICAVRALAECPRQWRALRAGDIDLDTAVEEILRWATPAMHFARTAQCDLVLGGRRIRSGDIVTLWNISANNDETVFATPRALDLSRTPNRHVTFGYGPHFCIGSFLGRAELHALLAALVDSVAELELDGIPTPVYSNFLYGYSRLPVRVRPR